MRADTPENTPILADVKQLLAEAIYRLDTGNVQGAGWRLADAADLIRQNLDIRGQQAQGIHYPTGLGNQLAKVSQ